MRHTRAHTANRRSHHALKMPRLSKCQCGAMHLRHATCTACGKYRGKVVIDIVKVAKKKDEKSRQKAEARKV